MTNPHSRRFRAFYNRLAPNRGGNPWSQSPIANCRPREVWPVTSFS